MKQRYGTLEITILFPLSLLITQIIHFLIDVKVIGVCDCDCATMCKWNVTKYQLEFDLWSYILVCILFESWNWVKIFQYLIHSNITFGQVNFQIHLKFLKLPQLHHIYTHTHTRNFKQIKGNMKYLTVEFSKKKLQITWFIKSNFYIFSHILNSPILWFFIHLTIIQTTTE